jgi:acyl-CoA synthetase (AMP-forming)/AMP-acid ligase II
VLPGDTVGINSYNRIEWIEAMFGAYKARADAINLTQIPAGSDEVAHARDHIAGYKIPRRLHLAETIQRTPAGKPDYRWAKAIFEA